MLEVFKINYTAGGRQIIDDLSASFHPGKLHLIVGPNGAGKSTLVKLLAGYLPPSSGSIEYGGTPVAEIPDRELAGFRSVLSQSVETAFPLTVREIVMMGRYPHFGGRPGPADEAVVDELLKLFEIAEFGRRNFQTLSGGERQRVNFARVLAQLRLPSNSRARCRYLFLDEPLTFLDIRHQLDFMKKVRAFTASSDVVTIGVVHDLNLAAGFADQMVLMNNGRCVENGAPKDVLTADRIREVFGVETKFIPLDDARQYLIFG